MKLIFDKYFLLSASVVFFNYSLFAARGSCGDWLGAMGVYYSSNEPIGGVESSTESFLVIHARGMFGLLSRTTKGREQQLLMMDWYVQILLNHGASFLRDIPQVRALFHESSGQYPSQLLETVFQKFRTGGFEGIEKALDWYRMYRTKLCFEVEDRQHLDRAFEQVFGFPAADRDHASRFAYRFDQAREDYQDPQRDEEDRIRIEFGVIFLPSGLVSDYPNERNEIRRMFETRFNADVWGLFERVFRWHQRQNSIRDSIEALYHATSSLCLNNDEFERLNRIFVAVYGFQPPPLSMP